MKRLLAASAVALTTALSLGLGATANADETKTIVENASADPQFSTLVAALGAAGLTSPFDSCDDPKTTVFAPTNDAFTKAFTALGVTADEVLANKELLTSILTYHVVSGEVPASAVVGLDSATTLQGEDIAISVAGDQVTLNGSVKVVATDVANCNGVIHVIDGVLLPPSVAASLAAPTMPATGADSGIIAAFAAGLIGVGALGVFGARRARLARVEA
ncbi:MAG: fasciclin domain-containing protein [Acidimicrobiales bacterium]